MDGSARVRKRLELPEIRVRYVSEAAESVGRLDNASRAGVFIRARALPRQGSIVALRFESPQGPVIDARGQVKWVSEGNSGEPRGFGVALREPPREFREFMLWMAEQAQGGEGKDDPEKL